MAEQQTYGRNSDQVANFIERLRQLTLQQRDEFNTGYSYRVDFEQMKADAPAEAQGLSAVFDAVDDAVRGVDPSGIRAALLFRMAATALAWADWLPHHQFALMYAGFRDLITVEELGPGMAPSSYEQVAAVYEFASSIEGGRPYAREGERSPLLVGVSLVAGFAGITASAVAGGWAGLITFFSVIALFVVSLWGQRIETSWTIPWRR